VGPFRWIKCLFSPISQTSTAHVARSLAGLSRRICDLLSNFISPLVQK
jgi:hypothetical protein